MWRWCCSLYASSRPEGLTTGRDSNPYQLHMECHDASLLNGHSQTARTIKYARIPRGFYAVGVGFYIRKSFKAGPFRLNLSKSGLGVSAGVKGARVGIDAKGRAYTHAGRYGLYHRQYHSGKAGQSTPRAARAFHASLDEELHMPTEATYPTTRAFLDQAASMPGAASINKPKRSVLGPFWAAVALLWVVVSFSESMPTWLIVVAYLGSAGLAAISVRSLLLSRARKRLETSVADALHISPADTPEPILIPEYLPSEDISFVGKNAFAELTLGVVEDGYVTEGEKAKMAWCERTFGLEPDFVSACRVAAFQTVFLRAVADHELTAEEETTLAHVQAELEIPDHAIAEMREAVSELAEIRRLREGQLRQIETAHKLQKSETCYFEAPGRLLKYNILRTFTENGVKHKVKGFEIAKQGVLLLTSKRITLRHEGASSIPYTKVLDVEVDADRNLITLITDGVQKPTYISTPRPLEAGAIIAQLARL